MRTSRLKQLERAIRSRPCAGCGKPFDESATRDEGEGWERLTSAERRELDGLIAAMSTPACARCGRSGFDLARMTDDQLDRALQLLRKVYGRTNPGFAEFCDAHVTRSAT